MSFLTKIKQLSPEQLERTKERIKTEPEFAKKFQGGIDSLIAADKAELKGLLTGQPVDPSNVPQGQVENKLIEEAKLENPDVVKTEEESLLQTGLNTIKDGLVGISSGVIPPKLSANINAGLEEVVETVGTATGLVEDSGQTFSDRVKTNESVINNLKEEANERSPIVSGAGEIAGTVAVSALPATAIASRLSKANKLAQGINAAQKTFAARAKVTAATTGTDFIVGALQIQAQKKGASLEGMVDSMKESGLYASIGGSIGVALDGVAQTYRIASNSQFKNLQMSRGVDKMYNSVRKFVADSAIYSSARNVIDEKRYIQTLSNIPGYDVLVDAGDMVGATKLVNGAMQSAKNVKSQAYRAMNNLGVTVPKNAVLETGEDILGLINDALADGATFTKKNIDIITSKLDDVKNVIDDGISLDKADEILNSEAMQKIAKLGGGEAMLGRLRGIINNTVDGVSQTGNTQLKKLADSVLDVNKDLQVLHHNYNAAKKVTTELLDVSERGIIKQVFAEAKDSLGNSPGLAKDVVSLVPAAVKSGRSILYNAGKVARQMRSIVEAGEGGAVANRVIQVTDFFTTGGAQNTKLGQLLVSGLGRYAGQEQDSEEVMQHIETMESAGHLLRSPMDRDNKSYAAKNQALKGIVKKFSPELYQTLNDMERSGENPGPVLEQLANHPMASEIFSPGVGWDGKTYDPAVKANIVKQIDLLPNSVGSSVIKKKLKEDLEISGNIPDLTKLPARRPRGQ